MASGHGGQRTPAHPAPVSGPGAMSKRTDGQPARYASGMPYGEGSDFLDLQSAAPMAQAASATPNTRQGPAPVPGAAPPVPLNAPTQRPDEPLTEGNPMGPGAGSGVLSTSTRSRGDLDALRRYLPDLELAAKWPDTPATFHALIQYLRNT